MKLVLENAMEEIEIVIVGEDHVPVELTITADTEMVTIMHKGKFIAGVCYEEAGEELATYIFPT